MTRDDIIRIALEAGIVAIHAEGATNWAEEVDALDRFAALVAAAEREACFQIALTIGDSHAGCRHTDEVARRIRARSQQ